MNIKTEVRIKMSIQEIKKVYKLFFPWQEKKEENWLVEMSKKGWHLNNVGFMNYTFIKGEPEDIIYRLDYRFIADSEMDDYITLFEEAGWEYIPKLKGSWHYFRTRANKRHIPEIYSDNTSKIKMYNSIRWLLIIISIPSIYNLVNITDRTMDMFKNRNIEDASGSVSAYFTVPILMFILLGFIIVIYGIVIYGIIRISLTIRNIKSDIRE